MFQFVSLFNRPTSEVRVILKVSVGSNVGVFVCSFANRGEGEKWFGRADVKCDSFHDRMQKRKVMQFRIRMMATTGKLSSSDFQDG